MMIRTDASVSLLSTLPPLENDKSALLAGDLAKVLAVLQQGLVSAEHQQFVEKLSS